MNRRAVRKLTNRRGAARCRGSPPRSACSSSAPSSGRCIKNGLAGMSPRVFTEMTPPPGCQRGTAECDLRQRRHDPHRHPHRRPDRHAGRHLSGRVRAHDPDRDRDPLRQRRAAVGAVDHHRPVRLRAAGDAHGALLGDRRRRGARDHRDARHGAHHRGHAEPGAAGHEGCLHRHGRVSLAHDHERHLPGRAQRHRSPGCCWRWRASAARPHRCCSPRSTTSSGAPTCSRPWRTCRW